MITHTVTEQEDGMLLRELLKQRFSVSHRTLAALKRRADGILLNGAHATVRAVLRVGDVVAFATDDLSEAFSDIPPLSIPVTALYEDEHIAAFYKPSGMPTHPSLYHHEDTLANALAFRYKGAPFVFRAIGRLDKETDGVVLTAKHAYAASRLGEAMQKREIEKEYYAIAEGLLPERGKIELPIEREAESIIKRKVSDTGEYALTLYERIAFNGEYSLMRVFPITGRTHQIRVHFAAIAHPLCGDTLYGGSTAFPRTMLHAHSLAFSHPLSGERLVIEAPLPEDFSLIFPSICK